MGHQPWMKLRHSPGSSTKDWRLPLALRAQESSRLRYPARYVDGTFRRRRLFLETVQVLKLSMQSGGSLWNFEGRFMQGDADRVQA